MFVGRRAELDLLTKNLDSRTLNLATILHLALSV